MKQLRILVGGCIVIGAVAWGVTGMRLTDISLEVMAGVPALLLLGFVILFWGSLGDKEQKEEK